MYYFYHKNSLFLTQINKERIIFKMTLLQIWIFLCNIILVIYLVSCSRTTVSLPSSCIHELLCITVWFTNRIRRAKILLVRYFICLVIKSKILTCTFLSRRKLQEIFTSKLAKSHIIFLEWVKITITIESNTFSFFRKQYYHLVLLYHYYIQYKIH